MTKLIKFLLSAVLILVLIWLVPKVFPGLAQAVSNSVPAARAVAVDCYVGISGQKASISVSGIASGVVCDKIASSDKRLYRLSQAPTERVMCERDYNGFHFTVRDQGILNLYGNELCKKIQNFQ